MSDKTKKLLASKNAGQRIYRGGKAGQLTVSQLNALSDRGFVNAFANPDRPYYIEYAEVTNLGVQVSAES